MSLRPVEIAMCIDEGMFGPAVVALHSIAAHADPTRQFNVHLVTTGVPDFAARVKEWLNSPTFQIRLTHVENPYAGFPENSYISPATYLRFLLPSLLEIDKLLYLDADLVARKDLGVLFDTDLQSRGLGAVPDYAMSVGSRYQPNFKLFFDGRDHTFATYAKKVVGLGRPVEDAYFNAGVMLIDLRRWRDSDFVDRVIGFIQRHPGLNFMDQDGLNFVCGGDYLRLDRRWNSVVGATSATPVRWRDRLSARSRLWAEVCAAWLNDPWIIHFAGPTKPWNATGTRTPMDELWWSYAKRSPAAAMFGSVLGARRSS